MNSFAEQDRIEQEQSARNVMRAAVRSSAFATGASLSADMGTGAGAAMVNRTHRVIRERAQTMRSERSKARSLWVPMGVCSVLLLMVCYAAWTMLSQNDAVPSSMPDPNEQISILTLWFLPVSVAVLAAVWFGALHRIGTIRRGRGRNEDKSSR